MAFSPVPAFTACRARLRAAAFQGDGSLQDAQRVADALFEEYETGLLPGIVGRQLLQPRDLLVDGGGGRVVRLKKMALAGDNVAPLAGLGVFHRRHQLFQRAEHLQRAGHPGRILAQPAKIPVP